MFHIERIGITVRLQMRVYILVRVIFIFAGIRAKNPSHAHANLSAFNILNPK